MEPWTESVVELVESIVVGAQLGEDAVDELGGGGGFENRDLTKFLSWPIRKSFEF